jgi:TPP-dependent pyruvate/acetoin dehydrogenase alpha subunit
MDVLAVEAATRHAAESIRAGSGPLLLEARTYRFRAHSMYDPELYRDKSEVEEWRKRCPIDNFAGNLRRAGIMTENDWTELEATATHQVAQAVDAAEAGACEPVEDLLKDVHTPRVPPPMASETRPEVGDGAERPQGSKLVHP